MSQGYDVPSGSSTDTIVSSALLIAQRGCDEINSVLSDIAADNSLNDNVAAGSSAAGWIHANYDVNVGSGLSTSSASGAMVVDDLMQKISTKVQVSAQLLSTANNINKTVARILSQG